MLSKGQRRGSKQLRDEEPDGLSPPLGVPPSALPSWTYQGVGVLRVELIRASGLRRADTFGLSDPYCKLQMGDQEFKSKTIKRTLDPVWNERYDFSITHELLTRRGGTGFCVGLSISDWDRFSRDDELGSAAISLDALLSPSLAAGEHCSFDVNLGSAGSEGIKQGRVFLNAWWLQRPVQSYLIGEIPAAPRIASPAPPTASPPAAGADRQLVATLRGEREHDRAALAAAGSREAALNARVAQLGEALSAAQAQQAAAHERAARAQQAAATAQQASVQQASVQQASDEQQQQLLLQQQWEATERVAALERELAAKDAGLDAAREEAKEEREKLVEAGRKRIAAADSVSQECKQQLAECRQQLQQQRQQQREGVAAEAEALRAKDAELIKVKAELLRSREAALAATCAAHTPPEPRPVGCDSARLAVTRPRQSEAVADLEKGIGRPCWRERLDQRR